MPLDKPLHLDFESEPEAPVSTGSDKQPLSEQLCELRNELQAKNKVLDAKNQEISELKIKNQQLNDTNNEIQARQKLLEEELGKAEAQIALIQELLLDNEETPGANEQEESGTYE